MAQWYRALTDIAEEQAHLLAPTFQLTTVYNSISKGFRALFWASAISGICTQYTSHSSHTLGKHLHTRNKNKETFLKEKKHELIHQSLFSESFPMNYSSFRNKRGDSSFSKGRDQSKVIKRSPHF